MKVKRNEKTEEKDEGFDALASPKSFYEGFRGTIKEYY
jgi:hypothetical protein